MKRHAAAVVTMAVLLSLAPSARGQEGKEPGAPKGPPPARVAVSEVGEGSVAPTVELVGSIAYPEVSDLSSEVSGKVLEVAVEEGDRVAAGEVLVRIDTELLDKTIASTRASHGQALADLERAKRDLARVESLYRQESVSEQLYDENRFRVQSLAKKAESLQAEVERLSVERGKKEIRAPFPGVVQRKRVDRGEWLSPGTAVLTLARDDAVDAVVDVPGEVLRHLSPGTVLPVRANGRRTTGRVAAIVPRGDVATRTFPVKVRLENRFGLIEGMEARVEVPTASRSRSLLVPRDALVTAMGKTMVFTVAEGKAKGIPVEVTAYEGNRAAVKGPGLSAGMPVIVKGNERVREGQPVAVSPGR
ncbi:MAG: efflux RND transporter periplasmic adaptor subunit [Deltaproteobacteria bacterium]